MANANQHSKLLFCAIGIFVCYFYFAMLQEKITRGQYGDGENREKFTYMFALVFVQCLVNYVFAKTILLTVMKQGEDTTSTLYYALSALTYLLAMVCSNMALQFVSYPTQVIGKAGKPIPVMILGVLLGKKVVRLVSRGSLSFLRDFVRSLDSSSTILSVAYINNSSWDSSCTFDLFLSIAL